MKLSNIDSRFYYSAIDSNGQIITVKTQQDFKNFNADILIEKSTGRVGCSISGYARLVGLDQSAISHRIRRQGYDKFDIEMAEVLTAGGLQGMTIIWETTISQWVVDDSPKLAKAMMQAGFRLFVHLMTGYTQTDELFRKQSNVYLLADNDVIVQVWKSELDQAITNGDQRRIHFYRNAINQWSQVIYLNPLGGTDGEQALPAKSEPTVEGAVDVVIRLGLKCPRNLESSLGKHVKKLCGDLLCGQDNRFSQTSDKVVPANMYPFKHPRVEAAVREYLEMKGL